MDIGEEKRIVIVGLGNPGREYAKTRHNIGDLIVRQFAAMYGCVFKGQSGFHAEVAKSIVDGVHIHLLLPTTYMNESGRAVRLYLDFYRLTPNELVIVCDDVGLPFGELRLRETGSSGGHNGLKSIEAHLGTRNYRRLRIGVGDKMPHQDLADHVLGKFSALEMEVLPQTIDRGVDVLKRLLTENTSQVMSDVNKKLKGEL